MWKPATCPISERPRGIAPMAWSRESAPKLDTRSALTRSKIATANDEAIAILAIVNVIFYNI